MNNMLELDRTDLLILQELQCTARISNQHLAERVNLSPSACLQRVRRLEENKILLSYHARLNLPLIGRHLLCLATVSIKNHTREDFLRFEDLIQSQAEIVECYTVSGEFDFLLKIICPDMQRYLEINNLLVDSSDYQVNINTHVVMKQNKYAAGIDLQSLKKQ